MAEVPIVPAPAEGGPSPNDHLRTFGERVETLIHLEAEVTAYEADLAEFRAQFSTRCGRFAAELADLELDIARLFHERGPDDLVLRLRLGRAEGMPRPRHLFELCQQHPATTAPRTAEAQALYHEIARLVHPDLARDPGEVPIRHEAMVRLNRSYAHSDFQGLRELLRYYVSGERIRERANDDLADYLTNTIAAMDRRIDVLRSRLEELEKSHSARIRDEMLCGASGAMLDGRRLEEGDPFERLARELQRRIGYTRQRLEQLRRPPVAPVAGRPQPSEGCDGLGPARASKLERLPVSALLRHRFKIAILGALETERAALVGLLENLNSDAVFLDPSAEATLRLDEQPVDLFLALHDEARRAGTGAPLPSYAPVACALEEAELAHYDGFGTPIHAPFSPILFRVIPRGIEDLRDVLEDGLTLRRYMRDHPDDDQPIGRKFVAGDALNILYVQDDDACRGPFRDFIEAGHAGPATVRLAPDGMKGLGEFTRRPPDILWT